MLVATPQDFSFEQTVKAHGWRALLPFTWNEDTRELDYVYEHSSGEVCVLRINAQGEALTVESAIEDNEVSTAVRQMLQIDLPLDDFNDYCRRHRTLSHIPVLKQGRLLVAPSIFEDVLKVVCTTNTTWAQTKSMVARIVDAYGAPLPSDTTRKAFPTSESIVKDSLEEFSAKAKLGYRNASVYKIATDVAGGVLELEALRSPEMSSQDLYKRLLTLPGIGPYAASCLMIYLGRYDRVNVNSWARMLVGKELGRPVTDKEAHAFFEGYGEWKALVYHFYKWKE